MQQLEKNKPYYNFTVGPVAMNDEILSMGSRQIPYFRTTEFSQIGLENEELIKKFVNTSKESRAIFLTSSGTGAMEATVINIFNKNDKVLIINGGSFGNRFKELCEIHDIPHEEIKLQYGEILKSEHLDIYKSKGFTGLLVNIHETSTGVLYDVDLISKFCKEENILLIVDAISSFLADEYYMDKYNIGATIIASQKALALPPGVSIIVLNKQSQERVNNNIVKNMYFNLKNYLSNGERGQTPFTPAVGILLQLNARLKELNKEGIENSIKRSQELAEDFRKKIIGLPLEVASKSMSNAVTPLMPIGNMKAHDIFEYLKDNYGIFVCPNGGELKDKLFRVGHIGNLSFKDNDVLINALNDMYEKGML